MEKKNKVFIATSLDGYIADENGGIEWLHEIPNPEGIDMGYSRFFSEIDAVVIGRNTFETVCGFNMPWPYKQPVFLLSSSMNEVPEKARDHAEIVKGNPSEVIANIHAKGYSRLYIDGGKTIQGFLEADLIDEMIITTIPMLLGKGIPLFGPLSRRLAFKCIDSKIYLNKIVQNRFIRTRQE